MMNGTIKTIVAGKPFGFIAPADGGKDVFFHESSLQGTSLSSLQPGMAVTFDVEEAEKGPRATNVALA